MPLLKLRVSRGKSLDRFYLFKLFGFGVFLHRIHGSDPENVWHSHPWDGLSLILGSYREHVYETDSWYLRRLFNWVVADKHHRVQLHRGPIWTIFCHLPKRNQWSIIRGGEKVHGHWEGEQGYKDYEEKVNVN